MHLHRSLLWAAVGLPSALAGSVLTTAGFTSCDVDTEVPITNMAMTFDKGDSRLTFTLAGTSPSEKNVTVKIAVSAYGSQVYSTTFNPCDSDTKVDALCPVPAGSFIAEGSQDIPESVSSNIPGIAFSIPDIAASATITLNSTTDASDLVACVEASVTNGKSTSSSAVSWGAAAIAGAALVVGGAGTGVAGGAAAGAGAGGAPTPSFLQVAGFMQGMAMNGMLSVSYPPVYRSFSKNFAFTTGLASWDGLQKSIDSFRGKTGGNLTADSIEKLRNTTLVYPDGSSEYMGTSTTTTAAKRALLMARDDSSSSIEKTVTGIQAFVEKLSIPKSNAFMTILLIVAIVILSVVCGILLVKLILEVWAHYGTLPKSLHGLRKHYWRSIARTITALIMLLYGVWALYCVFQFSKGDSWAAKTLAAITLIGFTGFLSFFGWKIWKTAEELKKNEGSADALYDKKELWVKYSMFYDNYRKEYWWAFVPVIAYAFTKGVTHGALDGHGAAQTAVQLVVEAIFLGVLVWWRPYERGSGNVVNISIQVVRVLSVICILIFVEELGVSETTQTVMGLVLIVIQSVLTATLAGLILYNVINGCIKMNPHRKRRKDAEKGLADNGNSDDITSFGPPSPSEKKLYVDVDGDERPASKMERVSRALSTRTSFMSTAGYKKGLRPASPTQGDRTSLIADAAPMEVVRDEKTGRFL